MWSHYLQGSKCWSDCERGKKGIRTAPSPPLGTELWPFDGCELSLTQMHQQPDILRSFVKYLDDPAYLHIAKRMAFTTLHILVDLSPGAALPELTLPAGTNSSLDGIPCGRHWMELNWSRI